MATDPRVETIRLLASIDASLKQITSYIKSVSDVAVGGLRAANTDRVPDALLAGPYGDPVVKAKDPRDWTSASQLGKHFSECPPEYLDLVAERLDYFAGKEDDATKAGYNRKDAARARGWAARLRGGWTAPVAAGRVNEADTEPSW